MTELMTSALDNDASTTRITTHKKTPSEIWDDDFEFQSSLSSNVHDMANDGHDLPPSLRQKIQSTERWQASDSVVNARTDSGPSGQPNGHDHNPRRVRNEVSSSRASHSHRLTPSKDHSVQKAVDVEENWDDDFVDKTDSPVRPTRSERVAHSPTKSSVTREENWDEDFEMGEDDNSHRQPHFPSAIEALRASIDVSPSSKRSRTEASWDSSSEDEDHGAETAGDDAEFGVFGRSRRADEEDRTVTARSRRRLMDMPMPSVPPLPTIPRQASWGHLSSLPASHIAHSQHSSFLPTIPSGDVPPSNSSPHMVSSLPPFPRSPTMSVFSIPGTTGSSSAHGSTTLLTGNLQRTLSGSSGAGQSRNAASKRFPATSPTRPPKERRRLRKKSRPPHLDGNIIELEDRSDFAIASEYLQRRPMTPEGRHGRRSRSHSRSSVRTPSLPRDSSDSMGSPMSVDADPVPSLPAMADSLLRPSSGQPVSASPLSPSHSMPTSPPRSGTGTGKSPLLTRIGSMKRWSAGMGLSNIGGSRRKRSSTGPDVVAAAEAERDRNDNNKTPRPTSSAAGRAVSPAPPLPPAEIEMHKRPSSSFRRPSEEIDSTPRKKEMKREKSADLRLKIVTSGFEHGHPEPQQQDVIASTSSPRRIRLRALGLGQRVPSSSSNASESTDLQTRQTVGEEVDVHMTSPTTSPSPKARSSLRPRLPSYRAPSSAPHNGQVKPRHFSGSAVTDARQSQSSEGGRSVSAVLPRPSGEDASDGRVEVEKKDGHRSFMGGMRRISLVGGQKRAKHRREKSNGSIAGVEDIVTGNAPPVPSLPSTSPQINSLPPSQSAGLLPPFELVSAPPRRSSLQRVETDIPSSTIDITSPISNPANPPLVDTSNISESSSAPALLHSRSSNPITSVSSNSLGGPPSSPTRKGKSTLGPIKPLNASPQAASLGRASQIMTPSKAAASGLTSSAMNMNAAMRRNSLGDLKIPSRISRAQDGLKRDLTRVREFAAHIEQMKEQRSEYYGLVNELQNVLETAPRPPSRALSPGFFNMSRPASRARSNTNPPPPPSDDYRQLALNFREIDSKYRVAWECADLLIDLGSGAGVVSSPVSPPLPIPVSATSPLEGTSGSVRVGKKGRERAVTLAGDESKPSTPINGSPSGVSAKEANPPALLSWRASTGRHDLNQRQLLLLKEMLNNADSAKEGTTVVNHNTDVFSSERIPSTTPPIPAWLQNDGMESTATLPTEESSSAACPSPQKKRPSSRLALLGLRDMLRSLKRGHQSGKSNQANGSIAGHSTTTLSTDASSHDVHHLSVVPVTHPPSSHPYPSHQTQETASPSRSPGRRRSKTSAQPDSIRVPSQGSGVSDFPRKPYLSGISLTQGHSQHKSSPRRPSLASLFRLGQKHKAASSGAVNGSENTPEKPSSSNAGKLSKDHSQNATENEGDDSDWDRMDSASDVDVPVDPVASPMTKGDAKGTLRSRLRRTPSRPEAAITPADSRPVTPGLSALNNASQMSLTSSSAEQSTAQLRLPRLSNVDEDRASEIPSGRITPASPTSNKRRSTSRNGKENDGASVQHSTVRTFPAGVKKVATGNGAIPVFDIAPMPLGADMPVKLSMTPDNIKPLLENAKIVTSRLGECIREVKELLSSRSYR